MIQLTPVYAAILALLGIALGARVSMLRGKTGISILHGDNMELATRIRKHGNFVEHVPYAVLMMAFAELLGMPPVLTHAQGVVLIAARVLHAAGLNTEHVASPVRIMGSAGTTLVTLSAVISVFWSAAMQ